MLFALAAVFLLAIIVLPQIWVRHTIARHSALMPASRQASARASRWNWSQETGKAFSGSDIGGTPADMECTWD
mgnify:CR=1 FL=1